MRQMLGEYLGDNALSKHVRDKELHKPHDARQLSGVSKPASDAYMLH